MNKDDYIKKINQIFKFNIKARKIFITQINNYYNAKDNSNKVTTNYNVGDDVFLKKGQFLRGEGAIRQVSSKLLEFISENGFVTPDLVGDYNKRQKTPLCIPVWNIQKDIYLKDYVNLYSGGTIKTYSRERNDYKTFLIPYNCIDSYLSKLSNFWKWDMEQTKEIRFIPSLAQDKV